MKELKFVQMGGIRYNEASVLVNVEEGAEVPVFVFSSSADGDFKERWEVVYRGRPRVCFGCYRPGHNRNQCPNEQVTFEALKEGPVQGSWAQVAKGLRPAEPILEGEGEQTSSSG